MRPKERRDSGQADLLRSRLTPKIKRELRRRSAVEPVIGHLKSEHRMGRNYLWHRAGDPRSSPGHHLFPKHLTYQGRFRLGPVRAKVSVRAARDAVYLPTVRTRAKEWCTFYSVLIHVGQPHVHDGQEVRMTRIFPLAGAVLVLLEVFPAMTIKAEGVLPIGGSHIAQLAVVLGLAFAIHEFISAVRHGGR